MKQLALNFIRLYQRTEFFRKPIFRNLFMSDASCRFTPSCSEYSHQSIEKYGLLKGSMLGLKRIIRCHPLSKGGFDPVP
ncbi:MAG: membrane protein insertion efficiency factor YidD [Candidatus Moranbacteria bacterium CG23_combo_of_CG06-09_8_20_14_all_39_10]|nr:MAG: membrane protein insertion efficiency factor YidD [Candidatus Moranbacteria bacterium CG23_combo_of_CG06-09_8_20_14_all_39_10]